MRAVDDARAEPGPELPVYQATVFDAPLTSDVAEPNGGAADPQRRLNGGHGAAESERCERRRVRTRHREVRGVVGMQRDHAAARRSRGSKSR